MRNMSFKLVQHYRDTALVTIQFCCEDGAVVWERFALSRAYEAILPLSNMGLN